MRSQRNDRTGRRRGSSMRNESQDNLRYSRHGDDYPNYGVSREEARSAGNINNYGGSADEDLFEGDYENDYQQLSRNRYSRNSGRGMRNESMNPERENYRGNYEDSRGQSNYRNSYDRREGNIIQRVSDRIRNVWDEWTHDDDRDEGSSYRRRRGSYEEDRDFDPAANWRRQNYDDMAEHDPEHHYDDHLRRQPFYDDGRISSRYNNELVERTRNNMQNTKRTRSNEWNGRNRRPGNSYYSGDNYHGRAAGWSNEDEQYNNDRG